MRTRLSGYVILLALCDMQLRCCYKIKHKHSFWDMLICSLNWDMPTTKKKSRYWYFSSIAVEMVTEFFVAPWLSVHHVWNGVYQTYPVITSVVSKTLGYYLDHRMQVFCAKTSVLVRIISRSTLTNLFIKVWIQSIYTRLMTHQCTRDKITEDTLWKHLQCSHWLY